MKNVRVSGRFLATLLALLMVLSTVIVLPVTAEGVTNPKKTLWEYDFSTAGTNGDGEVANNELVKFLEDAKVVSLCGRTTTATMTSTSAKITGGYFYPNNNGVGLNGQGTVTTMYDYLSGVYTVDNPTVDEYFVEFDFTVDSGALEPRSDADVQFTDPVTKATSTLTVYSDYTGLSGNGKIICLRAASSAESVFFLSSNGYLYAMDRDQTITSITNSYGVDDYLYYKADVNNDGKDETVYFAADGRRYYINGEDSRTYLDETAGTVTGLDSLTYALQPRYVAECPQIEWGHDYRVFIKYQNTVTAGFKGNKVKVVATSYIGEYTDGVLAGELSKMGTSTLTHSLPDYKAEETSTATTAANDVIWMACIGVVGFGGKMEAYTYTCTDTDHAGAISAGTKIADDDTVITVNTCVACGDQYAVIDGVVYTAEAVNVACLGRYTLWTATDGSYRTHKTDVVAPTAAHNYSPLGMCSTCKEWAYVGLNLANTSRAYPSRLAPKAPVNGTSTTVGDAPAYDATNKWLSAPDGGGVFVYTAAYEAGATSFPKLPLVISFDIRFDEILANDSAKEAHWPLLMYGPMGSILSVGVANATAQSNQLYLVLTKNHTYADGEGRAIAYMSLNAWYHFEVLVDPVVNAHYVYLNGEYVGSYKSTTALSDFTADQQVRIGAETADSYYRMAFTLDNWDIVKTNSASLFDGLSSNQLLKLNYNSFNLTSAMANEYTNAGNVWFGGSKSFQKGEGTTANGATVEVIGTAGNKYGIIQTTGGYDHYRDLGLSTSLTDAAPLSGKKYEICLDFAVPKTDTNNDGNYDAITNVEYGSCLVRIGKYGEGTKLELVWALSDGQYEAGGKRLYDVNGNPLTCVRPFNTDGTPTDTSKLSVVVDEANATFSVYVDNRVAYYDDGEGNMVPFVNRAYTSVIPSAVQALDSFKDGMTYKDVTKAMADAACVSTHGYHFARLFRHLSHVAVKEITINLIDDSNVTLIGTQTKSADNTTSGGFDLRFVFGIDDLFVSNIGFDVTAYKNGVQKGGLVTKTATDVYSAVVAGTETFHAYDCTEGEYLATLKVLGIEETSAEDTYRFEIKTFVTNTKTGEPVYGPVSYVVSCDGLGQNITTTRVIASN